MPLNRGHIGRMLGVALAVVLAAVGIGLGAYWINDTSQSEQNTAGDTSAADRLSVFATVEKVDPAQYTANVRIAAVPRGGLTSDDGETTNRDIRILGDGLGGDGLLLRAGHRLAAQNIPVELQRGEITNYPFDKYSADLFLSANGDGKIIPVEVIVENNDAFFNLGASGESDQGDAGMRIQLARSVSTYIMVVLMFFVMWALALSVATAAFIIGRNRLGLVWPAMAWMAATLFALAAFRGTAPGNPPIGTILDYTAFLWAEAIVACSLTYVVVRGVLMEWRKPTPAA